MGVVGSHLAATRAVACPRLDHGGPPGVFAPLALKTHLASHAGARAVLVKGLRSQTSWRLWITRYRAETFIWFIGLGILNFGWFVRRTW